MEIKRAQLINYNEKIVHFIDYSQLKNIDDFVKTVAEVDAFNAAQIKSGRKDFLILSDLSNSYIFGDALDALKKSGAKIKPYTHKTALLGITGAKSILLKTANALLNLNMKPFDNKEEALKWLTE